MPYNAVSTFTLQNELDKIMTFPHISPIVDVSGWTTLLGTTMANDVMTAICAVNFPHKWNEQALPQFYTNSWQQDYALVNPNGSSVTNMEWLERGVAFDINNSAIPKPWVTVEIGRQLPQRTGTYDGGNSATSLRNPGFLCNSFPNYSLYYGTWGDANVGNPTLGNNPVAGSVYTNPLGAISQPANPITQIIDANGNFLVLTTYGVEGSTAPLAALNAAPGTTASGSGASTVWTVVDPNGMGIRILSVPSQTGVVWQFNIVGQAVPVIFTSLNQKLTPLPDKYESFFRAGLIAQAYRYSPFEKMQAKFATEWQLWLKSLNDLRALEDVELEENSFVPDRGIMSGGVVNSSFQGAQWPFQYPRW
jgi:hypothetical protein